MGRDNGQKQNELLFSLLSGYDFYRITQSNETGWLGTHVQSGNIVRIKAIGKRETPIGAEELLRHRRYIWHTMPQDHYEWPIDLAEYQDQQQMYVQCYIFPLKPYPGFTPIRELLYQEKTSRRLDWRNAEIKEICRNLLKVFSGLHKSGYFYNDFCIDRIFYEPKTRDVFLRFSSGIRLYEQKEEKPEYMEWKPFLNQEASLKAGEQEIVPVKDISIEFAPPYIYDGTEYSGNIDDFSICSMLFRMMIGRMPYEGKGLNSFGEVFDPIRDVDRAAHEYYFEHYHQYPKFIFDPEDNSNSLGPMSENDLPKERWEKLPDKIKEMFQESLADYVQGKGRLYPPEEWLDVLNQLCWNEQKKGWV